MNRFVLILFSLTLSLAHAGEQGSVAKAAHGLSLDQLFAVQTLLRAKLDGATVCAPKFNAVSSAEVSMMPQLLEGEVQEKIRKMKANGALVGYLAEGSRLESCESKCRCDFYEAANGTPLNRKFKPLTNQSVLRCARANESWICKSAVIKALAAESKKAVSANE